MEINTNALISDLEALGWKKIPRKRTDIAIYQYQDCSRDGFFFQVTIPLDKELVDYDDAMLDALKTISDFTGSDLGSTMEKYKL